MPKTGKLYTMAFYVDCPHCGEAVPNPVDGSHIWETHHVEPVGVASTCPGCGKTVFVPRPRLLKVP